MNDVATKQSPTPWNRTARAIRAVKGNRRWAFAVGLLLAINLGWMSWNLHRQAGLAGADRRFKMEVLHTNNVSGIGLFDTETSQPLWARWNFVRDGNSVTEDYYYFRGQHAFEVWWMTNHPPI